MKFMIQIFDEQARKETITADQIHDAMEAHIRFAEQVPALGGTILAGNALRPVNSAASIRGDLVTDGPFIEAKEAIGGFYLISAPDIDTAVAIARTCPNFGGVEVRPIRDTTGA